MESTAKLNHLMYKYLNDNVKLSREKTTVVVTLVTEKIQTIVKYIHKQDKRFQSEVQCTGSYYQGLKVKTADEFDFNVFVAGFDNLTNWGSGGHPRHYKFNRDYDRTQNIAVHLECQFILPPILPLVAAASAYLPSPFGGKSAYGGPRLPIPDQQYRGIV